MHEHEGTKDIIVYFETEAQAENVCRNHSNFMDEDCDKFIRLVRLSKDLQGLIAAAGLAKRANKAAEKALAKKVAAANKIEEDLLELQKELDKRKKQLKEGKAEVAAADYPDSQSSMASSLSQLKPTRIRSMVLLTRGKWVISSFENVIPGRLLLVRRLDPGENPMAAVRLEVVDAHFCAPTKSPNSKLSFRQRFVQINTLQASKHPQDSGTEGHARAQKTI